MENIIEKHGKITYSLIDVYTLGKYLFQSWVLKHVEAIKLM